MYYAEVFFLGEISSVSAIFTPSEWQAGDLIDKVEHIFNGITSNYFVSGLLENKPVQMELENFLINQIGENEIWLMIRTSGRRAFIN